MVFYYVLGVFHIRGVGVFKVRGGHYLKRGCGGHFGTQDSPNAQQSVKENGFREREEETPDSRFWKSSGFLHATHPDDMLRHSPT